MRNFKKAAVSMLLALCLMFGTGGAFSMGEARAAVNASKTPDMSGSVTAKSTASVKANLKKLANAIVRKGKKNSQGNYYVRKVEESIIYLYPKLFQIFVTQNLMEHEGLILRSF